MRLQRFSRFSNEGGSAAIWLNKLGDDQVTNYLQHLGSSILFWPVPMDRESKRRRALDALGSVRSVTRTVVVEVLRCLDPDGRHDLSNGTRALTSDLKKSGSSAV